MFIIIPGAFNAQTGVPGGSQQGQIVTVGSILKVTERDRRPYPTDVGTPSEIWIDNTAGIGYICKEFDTGHGTVWDRLDLLGDFVTFGDSDPGVNIDIKLGYRPGSLRYARNSEILWICKDNTQGAAVWDVLSSGGGVVSVNGLTGVVQLYLDDILDVDAATPNDGDVLTWDSATSNWIAATGGGGTYTVNNGLSPDPLDANNFQLGGTLLKDTTIDANLFYLTITGAKSSPFPTFVVENTGTGSGMRIFANNVPLELFNNTPSLNTVQVSLQLRRTVTGAVSNGVGQSILFTNQASNGSFYLANRIISEITNVTPGNFTSKMIFTGTLNNIQKDILTLLGTGQLQLNTYTGTTFDGTAVKSLGVDASGNVITTTASPVSGESISPFLLMGG